METTAAGRIGAVDLSLAEIVRASQDGIALVWGDRIEWVNAALVAMLHVSANHLEGMLLDELEVLAAVPLQRRILLGDLRPDAGSVTGDLVRRTGSPLPVSIEASGLGLGADGRYAVTFRRLTPLVRAVQEAQVAQGQFEAMANHAPNGVFSSGHGLRLEYVNQRFASLFGEDAAALLDLGWLSHVTVDSVEAVRDAIGRTLDGEEVDFSFRVVVPGEGGRTLSACTVPLVRADRSVGFIGTLSMSEADTDDAGPRRAQVISRGLAEGIRRGALPLAYQPIRSLDDDHLVAVEALLRYHQPQLGPVPAIEAVQVAEATDQIVGLGRDVITTACRDLGRWRDMSGVTAPSYVAVNLSALQLEDPDLIDHVVAQLKSNWLVGTDLCLELTESELMRNPDRGADVLSELHRLGVRISLDDFGTGHSSLARLGRFPLDTIKLDRTFITHAGTDPTRATVARAATALAAALGVQVIAEGIETDAQRQWAQDLGCDYGQGHALGHPIPFTPLSLEAR
jgi:EAL domain-containing protein (putative c-di-GMP-specific phosphodiesterase class I)/PAS domain-containing protein